MFLSPMCGPCLFAWCWDVKAADPPIVRWQQGLERPAMPSKTLAETMAVRIALFPASRGICRVSQSLRCSPAAHAHVCGSLAAMALQALMASSSTSSRPAASLDSGMLSATCQSPCRTTSLTDTWQGGQLKSGTCVLVSTGRHGEAACASGAIIFQDFLLDFA